MLRILLLPFSLLNYKTLQPLDCRAVASDPSHLIWMSLRDLVTLLLALGALKSEPQSITTSSILSAYTLNPISLPQCAPGSRKPRHWETEAGFGERTKRAVLAKSVWPRLVLVGAFHPPWHLMGHADPANLQSPSTDVCPWAQLCSQLWGSSVKLSCPTPVDRTSEANPRLCEENLLPFKKTPTIPSNRFLVSETSFLRKPRGEGHLNEPKSWDLSLK